MLTRFYDKLFSYHYRKLEDKDSDPEVMPITIISFCQTANIMVLYVLVSYFFNVDKLLPIPYSVFVFFFLFAGINIYVYTYKGRKNTALKNNKHNLKGMGKISKIYLITSVALPMLLIVFFNEFGKGF